MLLPTPEKHMNTALKNGFNSVAPESSPLSSRRDPQVTQRAGRRRFTAADKLRILAEADACSLPGQLGALLRREGLYSSTLGSFRKQRDEGKLGKDPNQVRQQRRDKEAARQRDARKIAHLEAENKKLKILLDLQKKVAELMSLPQESPTDF
jgi:transposase-like protein